MGAISLVGSKVHSLTLTDLLLHHKTSKYSKINTI